MVLGFTETGESSPEIILGSFQSVDVRLALYSDCLRCSQGFFFASMENTIRIGGNPKDFTDLSGVAQVHARSFVLSG